MAARMRGWGAFNLALATLYLWLGLHVAPVRARAFTVALVVVAVLLVVAGAALILRLGVARRLAQLACAATLVFGLVVALLLSLSVGYLWGIYGAIGQAIGWGALVAAVIVVQLFVLPPLLELRALRRAS